MEVSNIMYTGKIQELIQILSYISKHNHRVTQSYRIQRSQILSIMYIYIYIYIYILVIYIYIYIY